MISHILEIITNFIIHTISYLGYFGVGVLMAVQSAAIPLPSEITMPFAGSLINTDRFNLFLLGLAGALGSVVGASLAYWIARVGGRQLVKKYGKIVLVSERDLELTENFFKKFGGAAIFLGRFIPVFNSFIALPAGLARANYLKFVFYTFLGAFGWCLALAYIGMHLGPAWLTLRERFHWVDYVIAALIVILGIWWIRRHFRQKARG